MTMKMKTNNWDIKYRVFPIDNDLGYAGKCLAGPNELYANIIDFHSNTLGGIVHELTEYIFAKWFATSPRKYGEDAICLTIIWFSDYTLTPYTVKILTIQNWEEYSVENLKNIAMAQDEFIQNNS